MDKILPRIALILMQIGAALYFGPMLMRLMKFVPAGQAGNLINFFILALIFAVLVWLVGHVGGVILKDTGSPTPVTLSYAIIGALIGAAIVAFLPIIPTYITKFSGLRIADLYFPLAGAIIGYSMQK